MLSVDITDPESDETGWTCVRCNEDVAQGDLHECLIEDKDT